MDGYKFMVLCLKHRNVIRKEIITKRKGIIFVVGVVGSEMVNLSGLS